MRLWATHSGDPAADAFEPPHGARRRAYHGLARAIFVSAADRATPPPHRRRLLQITRELGAAATSSRVADPDAAAEGTSPLAPVVVRASAAGLGSATLTIPLTTDLAMLPVAVAARPEEANRLEGFS